MNAFSLSKCPLRFATVIAGRTPTIFRQLMIPREKRACREGKCLVAFLAFVGQLSHLFPVDLKQNESEFLCNVPKAVHPRHVTFSTELEQRQLAPAHVNREGETATVSVAKDYVLSSAHTLKFDFIVTLADMSTYQKSNIVKRLIKH